jgi:hypothetical protein
MVVNKKQKTMKNAFEIEKTKEGYELTIKAGRGKFATALINGELTLEIDKDLAAIISKALYTPKKKPFKKGPAPLRTAEEKYNNESATAEKTHKEAPELVFERAIPEGITPKKSHSARKDK